jgi:hypothetical protein
VAIGAELTVLIWWSPRIGVVRPQTGSPVEIGTVVDPVAPPASLPTLGSTGPRLWNVPNLAMTEQTLLRHLSDVDVHIVQNVTRAIKESRMAIPARCLTSSEAVLLISHCIGRPHEQQSH